MIRKHILILVLTVFLPLAAQLQTINAKPPASRQPKLIVGLVIDQMRWDYMYRYKDL